MDFELYLLGLPAVASIIGYSTNWIAIRMLFRPLEEKKLFGFRMPFTPGLIPRRKSDIADNIGRAVGEHLLTPAALEERLGSSQVKSELKKALESWIESALTKERGSIEEMIPEDAETDLEALTENLVKELQAGIENLVAGEQLETLLREIIETGIEDLSEKKLGELVDRMSYEEITLKLEKLLSALADNDNLEANIREFWKRKLTELKDGGGGLADYLREELTELVIRQVETNLPSLLNKGAELLDRPELRSRIEELVVDLLDEKIHGEFEDDSVWDQVKLGFLETLVLPRDKLREKVSEIIEDGVPRLKSLLEREEVRKEMTDSAVESLEKILQKDLSELGWTDRGVERLAEILTDLSITLVKNDRVQSLVLEGLVVVLKKSEHRKVGDLVELGREDEQEALVRAISGYVIDSLKSEKVQEKFVSVVEGKIDDLQRKKLGKLSRWVDPELLTPFAGPVVDRLSVVVAREGSNILSALDVKELVKDEVEKFSTLRVEKLILDVTGDQFRAITWFGALIGFVIGLLQILIITLGG
ncbi:DUF445 domain-containing protein [Candidatus Bipolaricaulota bacterium]|nr:DUF445 domain-containing protein [Candidatus Bipolaricaulota bacterium]